MKILYLITKSEVGGAQTHVLQLSKYFITKGNEVVVMAYSGGWLEDEIKKVGGKFFSNQYFSNSVCPLNFIRALKKTKEVINEFKPDLVHCHSSAAGVFGRLTVRNKIKTIYTAHGWGFNLGIPVIQKWLAIIIEKYLARYCEKIICVSEFVKNLALQYRIAPANKLEIIYNGVEDYGQKVIRADDKIKIIFVGRMTEPKDPLFLLKALKELKARDVVEVEIVGEGTKRKELESYILINNLQNVKLLGELSRNETLKLLKQNDVFVLISKWEGLPITILEAMSVGLPIVASNVGGINEMVNHTNGWLLKNNKVDELVQILNMIINNKMVLKSKGEASRLKVINDFNLEKMLDKIEEIYKYNP